MKRPSFQFYPGDWVNDPKLKMVDWEAQGLWMLLLCYMHNDYDYGYLCIGDRYLDETAIQRLLNANARRFHRVFNSLITADIIAVDEKGFYSRRMVRDEQLRRVRVDAGKQGGNPNLLNQKLKQTIKQKPTPSSSSSSSSKKKKVPAYKFNDAQMGLAVEFWDTVKLNHGFLSDPDLDAWADTIRKINEIDRYSIEEIEDLATWALVESDFWKGPIQSVEGFRRNFKKILGQSGLYEKWERKRRNGVQG